jgi:hypothetical protein
MILIFFITAGSIELISLKDYTLDLGQYTLPTRDGSRTHIEPIISDNTIIEGVR